MPGGQRRIPAPRAGGAGPTGAAAAGAPHGSGPRSPPAPRASPARHLPSAPGRAMLGRAAASQRHCPEPPEEVVVERGGAAPASCRRLPLPHPPADRPVPQCRAAPARPFMLCGPRSPLASPPPPAPPGRAARLPPGRLHRKPGRLRGGRGAQPAVLGCCAGRSRPDLPGRAPPRPEGALSVPLCGPARSSRGRRLHLWQGAGGASPAGPRPEQ